jgi:uroporphyrinogen decarboxylase
MAYANVRDDFLACTAGRRPGRMPVFSLSFLFHQSQAGVTDRQNRLDVAKAVACQVEGVRKYDEDWAAIFPDDYIEFEPLGLAMRDDEEHPTMPTAYLPFCRETLRRFRIPDAGREMRLPIHLEMIRRLKDQLGDRVLVMGRIAAPLSTLGLIYGIEELMVGMIADPGLIDDNLKFFIDHQIAFGQAQLDAGADLLWLGDCCASSKFCSLDHCCRFAFAAAAEVAAALKSSGGLLIYHACENSIPYLAKEVQLPVHAVNVGEGYCLAEVRQALGSPMCLMGNLDPLRLRDGSPEEVAAATERMIRENMPAGRYIFDTGEGVICNSPPANVAAMLDTAKAFNTITGAPRPEAAGGRAAPAGINEGSF